MENDPIRKERMEKLFRTILRLSSEEECRAFFEDLCTPKELEQMAERLHAAGLLLDGKTYGEIISETDISSATLSRVSRCTKYGTGYVSVLKQKKKKKTGQ